MHVHRCSLVLEWGEGQREGRGTDFSGRGARSHDPEIMSRAEIKSRLLK